MTTLDTILIAISGFLIGSFIPFALTYLAVYLRRHKLSWKTMLGLLLRLLLIPVVWMLVIGIAGLMLPFEDLEQVPEGASTLLGMMAGTGFLAGVVVFIAGLVSAIRSRKRHVESSPDSPPTPGH